MLRACSLVLLLNLLLLPGCARGEEKKTAGAPDAAKVESFLRRYYNWPDVVKVEVGAFRPASVPGMVETTVRLSAEGQHQDVEFLVSSDGRYLLPGPVLDLAGDPFAANRQKMALKDHPSLGGEQAPVTVVEYSDFQCPFCRGMAIALKDQVVPEFKGQVRLVFKDFPLTQIHPWAMPGALLGRCIHRQYGDAFWNFHDWAFSNQQQLNTENFKEKALAFAKEKGMDTAKLTSCMAEPGVQSEVQRSLDEAQSLGVTGTPTIFINGRKIVGNQPLPQLRNTIKTELDFVTANK